MKHLEKTDMKKLSEGKQDILEMSEVMINAWKVYQHQIGDEKLKTTINKKIKTLNNLLNQARSGLGYSELILVSEYVGLWVFFQDIGKSGNYDSESILANTSEKIGLFIKYQDTFTDEEYWRNLGFNYQLQDYKKIPYSTYYKLFLCERDKREMLMNAAEFEFYNSLPDKFTIYRGGTKSEAKSKKYGVSWTINKAIAEKFQNVKQSRDGKTMVVHELEINKSEAIAYLNDRKEEEIIYIHPSFTKLT
jgi:hypothetical protein